MTRRFVTFRIALPRHGILTSRNPTLKPSIVVGGHIFCGSRGPGGGVGGPGGGFLDDSSGSGFPLLLLRSKPPPGPPTPPPGPRSLRKLRPPPRLWRVLGYSVQVYSLLGPGGPILGFPSFSHLFLSAVLVFPSVS